MSLNKIVVIGSSNTDMVIKADKLPEPGETVLGGNFMTFFGGKGANQAVAAARSGGDVIFITKIGKDLFGQQSLENYSKENIDISHIFQDINQPSGVALITVDKNGENSIAVASGANATLKIEDIQKVEDVIVNANVLLMQLEIPIETVEYAAKLANNSKIKVVLNPAPAIHISDELLSNVHVVIPNRNEAENLSGIIIDDWETAKKAANAISSRGVSNVIITLGSAGVFVKEGDHYYKIESTKVNVVDTTGAGDTFCGVFSVAISQGKSILQAVEVANIAAGIAVSRPGAQNSIPYWHELSQIN